MSVKKFHIYENVWKTKISKMLSSANKFNLYLSANHSFTLSRIDIHFCFLTYIYVYIVLCTDTKPFPLVIQTECIRISVECNNSHLLVVVTELKIKMKWVVLLWLFYQSFASHYALNDLIIYRIAFRSEWNTIPQHTYQQDKKNRE